MSYLLTKVNGLCRPESLSVVPDKLANEVELDFVGLFNILVAEAGQNLKLIRTNSLL